MKTLIVLGLLVLAVFAFVPQVSADTCVFGYQPGGLANVCYFTSASDSHCGKPVLGTLCPGVKVQVDPGVFIQVGVNYGSPVCVEYSCP